MGVPGADESIARIAAGRALTQYVTTLQEGERIADPTAWITTTVRRRVKDQLKADGRFQRRFGPLPALGNDQNWDPPDPGFVSDPLISREDQKRRDLVMRCTLALLNHKDAEVLWRVLSQLGDDQGDMSMRELAESLNYEHTGSLRNRLRKIYQQVGTLALKVVTHDKPVGGSQELLVELLEQRIGVSERQFSQEVEHAVEWAKTHSKRPLDQAGTAHQYLATTWAHVARGTGRPGLKQLARRRLVAAAAAYVLLPDDTIPDDNTDRGMQDDYLILHAVRRAMGLKALHQGGTEPDDLGMGIPHS